METTETVRSIATCKTCAARHLFIGSVDDRDGMKCACEFETLIYWRNAGPLQRSDVRWATIKGKRTNTPCNSACEMSTSPVCNCQCAGDNHGAALRH